LNGARFAAIAEVGAVFSEMKFSVMPPNCFHSSPATGFALLLGPRNLRATARRLRRRHPKHFTT
jgi:hypothetical protein